MMKEWKTEKSGMHTLHNIYIQPAPNNDHTKTKTMFISQNKHHFYVEMQVNERQINNATFNKDRTKSQAPVSLIKVSVVGEKRQNSHMFTTWNHSFGTI